jgi:hypothetical protein
MVVDPGAITEPSGAELALVRELVTATAVGIGAVVSTVEESGWEAATLGGVS